MRAFDKGSTFGVQCTCDDVEAFDARWPCSGFRYGDRVSFEFDKLTGDLVGADYRGHWDKGPSDDSHVDGAAMVALSQDAQSYGATRLALK